MKDKDFTVISNEVLRDENLSLKAKGFLVYLLSLSDDWDFSIHGIMKTTKEGEESIRTCIKQLIKNNYMKCEPVRINGRFAYNQYTIIEKPSMVKPYMEKPDTVNPDTVKPNVVNKDMYQNDTNKDIKTPLPIEPHLGKPDMANKAQRNTINNKINNNKEIKEKFLFSKSKIFNLDKFIRMLLINFKCDINLIKDIYKKFNENEKSKLYEFDTIEWINYFTDLFDQMIEKNKNENKPMTIERINIIDAKGISKHLKFNLEESKKESEKKERFNSSIYFNWPKNEELPIYENKQLFTFEFQQRNINNYLDIDLDYYFDAIKNYSINNPEKKYVDFILVCKSFIDRDVHPRKKQVIQQPTTQNEKDISHYITLEDFMKFNHNANGIAIFINNAKDAIPNIIHILPEITHWKTLEYFCDYEFGVDDLNFKEANARIKYSPTHKEFFDYSIIDQQYYEEMKRKRKYIPYSEFKKSIGINKQVE